MSKKQDNEVKEEKNIQEPEMNEKSKEQEAIEGKSKKEEKPKKDKPDFEAENKDLKDRMLRTMAEFDNYKKRTAKEKEELMDYTKVLCVKELLPSIDSFEIGLLAESKDKDFTKGMELVYGQLKEALKKLGVEEIEALNKPFDPEIHSAIKQINDENFGDNIVCEVFQKGYSLNGKIIRHSVVAVANP